ncbi:MAG: hypothetical protein ACYST0_04360 [Planctomycetota bacterium]
MAVKAMEQERRVRDLQQMADQVCSRILDDDYPDIDIEIAIQNLREQAAAWFPGREELFAMIYESRFERLRQQFRSATR